MATETTTLEVVIQGKDNFTATAAKVTGAVKAMETGVGRTGGALTALSGRLGHAKSAIGGLLTGPLGVLGLSAGIFSLGAIMEQTIAKTTDFAFSVEKLMGLTGGTAEAMSGLLAVFEKFGVNAERTGQIVGFAEKTLGRLAVNGKLSNTILENFGFSVRNANGTVKTFGQTLNYVSDYYNANHSAASKAALAAQIFGRGYADLIPILKLGSKGIAEAEAAAKDLGLTLTSQNARDLKDYRENLRELGDAASGLQLQIGLALVPAINEMAKGITRFVSQNRDNIVQFFKDAASNVEKFGGFIEHDVIPPLVAFGTVASSAWNAVPEPLKQILIGGVIANKTGKFLFDFGLKDALNLGKGIFSRGGNPAEPLFVKDVGGVAGGGGGVGIVGALGVGALALGIAEAIREAVDFRSAQDALVAGGLTRPQALQSQLDAMSPSSSAYALHHGAYLGLPSASGSGGLSPDDRQAMHDAAQNLQDVKDASQGTAKEIIAMGNATREANRSLALLGGDKSWLSTLAKGVHSRSVARFGGTGLGHSAEIATYNRDILGRMRSIDKSSAGSESKIARLQQLLRDAKLATDATKTRLSADIKHLAASIHQTPIKVTLNNSTTLLYNGRKISQVIASTVAYGKPAGSGRIYEP